MSGPPCEGRPAAAGRPARAPFEGAARLLPASRCAKTIGATTWPGQSPTPLTQARQPHEQFRRASLHAMLPPVCAHRGVRDRGQERAPNRRLWVTAMRCGSDAQVLRDNGAGIRLIHGAQEAPTRSAPHMCRIQERPIESANADLYDLLILRPWPPRFFRLSGSVLRPTRLASVASRRPSRSHAVTCHGCSHSWAERRCKASPH